MPDRSLGGARPLPPSAAACLLRGAGRAGDRSKVGSQTEPTSAARRPAGRASKLPAAPFDREITAIPARSPPHALLRSAGAASLSSVWRMGVTFATHMALRRMIAPAEMGVWTWAEPVFILLAQVRDLGVPGHVVRQSRRAYGNYLGLQIGWGGALAAALAIGAPILAYGFAGRDAATLPILRALCLFLFVQGLGSVPLTFFEAESAIERTIPAELARNVCFAALSLLLALRGWGVWSIVIAHIAAAALYSAMLWWAALRPRADDAAGAPRLRLEAVPGATWPLVRSSLPLMVLSLLELGVLNLDPMVLGLRLEAGVVGTAGLAILAAFFVSRQLADAAGRAVYPALVRYRDHPPRAFEVFRVATLFLLTLVVPVAFFVFWNAELVVAILSLGRADWQAATGYLRVAAFVPLARPLTMFGRELLLVYHRDRLLIGYTLGNLVALGGLGYLLIGTELRQLGMAVAGYFPLGMLLLAWGLWQLEPAGFRRLMRDIGGLYLLGLLLFAPIALLSTATPIWRFALSTLAAALFVAVALRRHRGLYRAFLALD